MKFYTDIFKRIVSLLNLFQAWDEFKTDKLNKKDVLFFEHSLEENIFELHRELKYHKYKHGVYTAFTITDPKQRRIHKAIVRDRVLHHAIFRILNPIFEPTFISNSFSCRIGKGTHRGVDALVTMTNRVSKNHTRDCFVLKCDVKKFFDSIDHQILLNTIKRRIKDLDFHWLIEEIVGSFCLEPQVQLSLFDTSPSTGSVFERERERERERVNRPSADNLKGIPIGNLTSQLFANIYMNEFDQFVKHELKVKHYARYTDDFVIVSDDHQYLVDLIPKIESYLEVSLKLKLHPNKVTIRKVCQGVDFLGYIVFPHHRLLRTKTRRRIFKKLKQRVGEYRVGAISEDTLKQPLNSFLGVLSHANAFEVSEGLKNQFWFWLTE